MVEDARRERTKRFATFDSAVHRVAKTRVVGGREQRAKTERAWPPLRAPRRERDDAAPSEDLCSALERARGSRGIETEPPREIGADIRVEGQAERGRAERRRPRIAELERAEDCRSER